MNRAISRDGTQIGYVQSGSGPALLLVHGTTASHQRWSAITPRFEDSFTVYAMDRRGRGGSSDGAEYDLVREAEDIVAVIEAINEPVFLLGHSYGANCCLEAVLLTDKIRRLILYEPDIPTDISHNFLKFVPEMQSCIDQGKLEAALEIMFKDVVRMPDYEFEAYKQLPMWKVRVKIAPTIPRELKAVMSYQFHPEKFLAVDLPILLLLGDESPADIQKGMILLNNSLPSSTLIRMPGEQHIAMDTNPDLFVHKVEKFLKDKDISDIA